MPVDSQEGKYVRQPTAEIQQSIEQRQDSAFAEIGVDPDHSDSSVFTSFNDSFAGTLYENQERSLQEVYESAFLEYATGQDLEHVVAILGIERRSATHATGVVEFSKTNVSSQDYTIPKGTVVQADVGEGEPIRFETTEIVTIESGTLTQQANVRAVDGGRRGNVPPEVITILPAPPTGVDSVTNPTATGQTDLLDRDDNAYQVGTERESDDELRERARRTRTVGGSATFDAVLSALLSSDDLPGVQSVTLYNNRTASEGDDGLPKYSHEAVIYGGDEQRIAQSLHDVLGITSTGVSGIHGDTVSREVTAINGQTRTMEFSRPTKLTVQLELDIVQMGDGTYIGDTNLKDRIIEYIGGTNTDAETVLGLGVGQHIHIDWIEDIVVGDDTGVQGIASLSTSPSITTDSDGLEVVSVSGDTVPVTDPSQITIT